jgi:hypothetical protein
VFLIGNGVFYYENGGFYYENCGFHFGNAAFQLFLHLKNSVFRYENVFLGFFHIKWVFSICF